MSKEYVIDRITEATTARETLLECICNDFTQYPRRGIERVFNMVWDHLTTPGEGEEQKPYKTYSAINSAGLADSFGADSNTVVDTFVSTYGLKLFKTYHLTRSFFKDFYKER